MDQILKDIGNSLSGIFSSEIVQLGLKAVGIYIVFLWLATALWAYQDMKSRTANPLLPYLAAALIIVFTPILFIFAALLYRIIRPHERVGEAHERMLAEEAMLAEVEQVDHCLGCGRRVDDGWLVCPTCRTRLRRVCPNCGKLVGTDWLLCAWCGTDFEVSQNRGAAVGAGPYAAPRPASRPAGGAPVRQAAPVAATAAAAERPAPAPDRYAMATPAPAARPESRPPLDDVPSVRDDSRPTSMPYAGRPSPGTDPYDPDAVAHADGLSAAAYASPQPARAAGGSLPADATAPVTTPRTRARRPTDAADATLDTGRAPEPAPIEPAPIGPTPPSAAAPDAAPTAAPSAAPISGRRAAQR